jgi:hypothetical protein
MGNETTLAAINATMLVDDLVVRAEYQPIPCPVDFNGSGGADVGDIFAYLTAWFAGEARADFNGAGGIDVQDIFDFLGAWFAGC